MLRSHHALALALVGLSGLVVACDSLLGLDELRARVAVDGTESDDDGGTSHEDASASTCTSHKECIKQLNSAAVCAKGACAKIDTELCYPEVFPSNDVLGDDKAVLIAAFTPDAEQRGGDVYAYRLALEELNSAGGVRIGSSSAHPLAMAICTAAPESVGRAVDHVIDDLGVPAIVANFDAADIPKLLLENARAKEVFAINPNTTPKVLKFASKERLIWSLLGTPEDVALAYRPLLLRLEGHLKQSTPPRESLKVALLTTKDSLEKPISDALRQVPVTGEDTSPKPTLFFNGKTFKDNESDGNFLYLQVERYAGEPAPNYKEAIDSLVAFNPDVIIALTVSEVSAIVEAVETGIADLHPDVRDPDGLDRLLPRWILGPRNARAVLGYINGPKAVQRAEDSRKRFMGVQYAGPTDTTQREAWLQRMKDRWGPNVPLATYEASENFYDAVYWLGYGFVAAGPDASSTGTSIGLGVSRMLDGAPIYPGGAEIIGEAFAGLSSSTRTFVGALGPPDFDKAFNTWNSVGAAYCYQLAEGSTTTYAPAYDVLRYDRDTGELDAVGDVESRCFIGF